MCVCFYFFISFLCHCLVFTASIIRLYLFTMDVSVCNKTCLIDRLIINYHSIFPSVLFLQQLFCALSGPCFVSILLSFLFVIIIVVILLLITIVHNHHRWPATMVVPFWQSVIV